MFPSNFPSTDTFTLLFSYEFPAVFAVELSFIDLSPVLQ